MVNLSKLCMPNLLDVLGHEYDEVIEASAGEVDGYVRNAYEGPAVGQ